MKNGEVDASVSSQW